MSEDSCTQTHIFACDSSMQSGIILSLIIDHLLLLLITPYFILFNMLFLPCRSRIRNNSVKIDRCVTEKGSKIVQSIQPMLTEYLQDIVADNHPDRPRLFGQMLLFSTDMRTNTGFCDYYLKEIIKTFKHALHLTYSQLAMIADDGLAYEASRPSCDDAPPVKRVKQLLLSDSVPEF